MFHDGLDTCGLHINFRDFITMEYMNKCIQSKLTETV